MATKKKLKVIVLFDTNVIYTGSASDLFRKEIAELITNHSSLNDIDIEWHLPEVVLNERKFQMNKEGGKLLPAIEKLEKLLGHNLAINKSIIETQINVAVQAQLEKYSINVKKLDTSKVKWEEIIHKSVQRHPPFEDNDKEKGSRDAMILESLKQIIETYPSTKSICRIVFISNDGLLNDAATKLSEVSSNLNIFNNIDEFVSLINILNSEITEEKINSISGDAAKLFFRKEAPDKDDTTTLFYVGNIREEINNQFKDELNAKPEGIDIRMNSGSWTIINSTKPGFEKKEKQRVFWKSLIGVNFETFKIVNEPDKTEVNPILKSLGVNLAKDPKKEPVGQGTTRFEVLWSVGNKLKNPKVESIKYLDTVSK